MTVVANTSVFIDTLCGNPAAANVLRDASASDPLHVSDVSVSPVA